MSDDLDPPRLLDSNDVPDELRRGLEGLRGHVPSPGQLSALSNRLGVEHAAAPSAAAPGSAIVAKALVGVGIAVSGAGLLWFLRSASPGSAPAGAEQPSTALAAPAPSAVTEERAKNAIGLAPGSGAPSNAVEPRSDRVEREDMPEAPAGAEGPVATEHKEPRGSASGRSTPPGSVESNARGEATGSSARTPSKTVTPSGVASTIREAPKSGESEIALLRDARATLAVDPAEALAITERHRAAFPRGALGQEREIIAITALVKLGRTDAAQKRAEQFRAAHPTSAYLVQLERILPKK